MTAVFSACGCNIYGAVRDDCEQMTGRCLCKRQNMGLKCDRCPDGSDISATGCDGTSMYLYMYILP